MIEYSIRDGHIVFNVKVVPRASRSELAGEQDGALRVRIAAPPVDGAANEELKRLIAKKLEVKPRSVTIVSGRSSRIKKITVEGVSAEKLLALAAK
ncbi:MAG TPA: DUF167 domain-containing protein [Pyrinomonadaceae bacterium]|nr:DUF167 domain-containing protein [Pyrinomonadaceae bacterium]